MVNFKRLADRAKKLVDQQGGTDVVKGKAEDLREIAQGQGSVSDKAKAAADVVKEDRAETPGTAPEASTEGAETAGGNATSGAADSVPGDAAGKSGKGQG